MKNFAVLLGGCGTKDGSEINETVCLLLALDQHGIKYQCFAPDLDQFEVINHITGEPMNEKRNMMVEAARIVRGEILPLSQFSAERFDALVIPGGAGIAKNLFTYFVNGINMQVLPGVKEAITAMHQQQKPIGAMCIAPVVLAKVLGNIHITLGSDNCQPAHDIKVMGAKHIAASNGDVVSDFENKIFTTPCFMLNATLKDIYEDAWNLVEAMI